MRKYSAIILKLLRFKPYYSHDIAGDLTCGYGQLDDLGYFEYPLKIKGDK